MKICKKAAALVGILLAAMLLCMPAFAENIAGVPNYTWGPGYNATYNTGFSASISSTRSGNTVTYKAIYGIPNGIAKITTVSYDWQYYRNGSWGSIPNSNNNTLKWDCSPTTYNDKIRCIVSIGVPGGLDIIDDAYQIFQNRNVDKDGYRDWGNLLLTHNFVATVNSTSLDGNVDPLGKQYLGSGYQCISEAEAMIAAVVFADEYMSYVSSDGNARVMGDGNGGWKFNTDFVGDLIRQCYSFLLRKQPTDGELNHWIGQFQRDSEPSKTFAHYYTKLGKTVHFQKGLLIVIQGIANSAEIKTEGSAFRDRYSYADYDGSQFHFGTESNGTYYPYTINHVITSNELDVPDPVYSVWVQGVRWHPINGWTYDIGSKSWTLSLNEYFNISSHQSEFTTPTGYHYGGADTDDWWYTSPYSYHGNSTAFYIWGSDVAGQLHYYPNTFYIQFDPNGGTNVGTQKQAFAFDAGGSFNVTQPARTGYTFRCWRENSTGNEFPNNFSSVGNWRNGNGETVYLTAQWTPNKYTITFDDNGGSGGPGKAYPVYMQWGLNPNGSGGADDIRHWIPIRTGYTFTGYYDYADNLIYGTNGWVSYTNASTWLWQRIDRDGMSGAATWVYGGDVTLYAHWTANKYLLTVNPNGGILKGDNFGSNEGTSNNSAVQVTYGSTAYYLLGTASRTGYTFLGWYDAKSGGTQVFDSGGTAIQGTAYWNTSWQWKYTGNVTIWAHWKPSNYTVHFDGNGATAGSMSDQTVQYGTDAALAANTFEQTGYTFAGWNTAADGSGTGYADQATVKNLAEPGGSVTLYAQWKVRNAMTAEVKNLTADSKFYKTNHFIKTEYGNIKITLRGEITKVEITYPEALVSCAEPEDLLAPATLTVGSGITADGKVSPVEFFIPVNFNDELTSTVTVTATYADGEVITQTPALVVERIPEGASKFHTRLL